MLGRVTVEHRRDVVLGVAGGEQHPRHRQDMSDTLALQRIEAVADDRPGEFEVAVLDRLRQALCEAAGQDGKLCHGVIVAAAMAAQHHALPATHECLSRAASQRRASLAAP